MNISSEIFTTDKSNSSDHFFFNDTRLEIGFEQMATVYIITPLLGVPTNSCDIVTGTGNGLAAELFSLNLAVCEILLCLNSLFTVFTHSFIILCLLIFSGQGLNSTGCPLFQCLMCVERYLAVVHPVTFLKFKPLRYRVICSVIVWTSIFASCGILILLVYFFLIKLVFPFIVSQLILYLSIQLFCCVAVLRALKQSGPVQPLLFLHRVGKLPFTKCK